MDLVQLAKAFDLVHSQVDLPNVTIRLGQYEWKVHRTGLIRRSDFFRAALNSSCQEAASVSIALDGEDPWMLARLIQYLYYDVYQGHQDDYLQDAAGALNLPGMMRQFSHTDIRSDAEADHQRNSCMIHCMMAKMGERYGVPLLIYVAAARMHTAFNSDPPQGSVEDQFWSLCQTLGSEALFRHVMVQSALTHMVATHFFQLDSPRLRKWCDDHGLAYCIAQSISERLSRIQQKAPNDPSRDEGSGSTASDTSPG